MSNKGILEMAEMLGLKVELSPIEYRDLMELVHTLNEENHELKKELSEYKNQASNLQIALKSSTDLIESKSRIIRDTSSNLSEAILTNIKYSSDLYKANKEIERLNKVLNSNILVRLFKKEKIW